MSEGTWCWGGPRKSISDLLVERLQAFHHIHLQIVHLETGPSPAQSPSPKSPSLSLSPSSSPFLVPNRDLLLQEPARTRCSWLCCQRCCWVKMMIMIIMQLMMINAPRERNDHSCCCDFQHIFIGPRYTWGPIYGSECLQMSDSKTLLKQVMQVLQVMQGICKLCKKCASYVRNMRVMQVICKFCKLCKEYASYASNMQADNANRAFQGNVAM